MFYCLHHFMQSQTHWYDAKYCLYVSYD